MIGFDDDVPQGKHKHFLGEDLSLFSVADLDHRIEELQTEIERLKAERTRKGNSITAAEALFR